MDEALWLEIANRQTAEPSTLATDSRLFDLTAWPGPIVRLFLGQIAPADVLAAARTSNVGKQLDRMCEADVYLGEFSRPSGSQDEATTRFNAAMIECSHMSFPEWAAAHAELGNPLPTPAPTK